MAILSLLSLATASQAFILQFHEADSKQRFTTINENGVGTTYAEYELCCMPNQAGENVGDDCVLEGGITLTFKVGGRAMGTDTGEGSKGVAGDLSQQTQMCGYHDSDDCAFSNFLRFQAGNTGGNACDDTNPFPVDCGWDGDYNGFPQGFQSTPAACNLPEARWGVNGDIYLTAANGSTTPLDISDATGTADASRGNFTPDVYPQCFPILNVFPDGLNNPTTGLKMHADLDFDSPEGACRTLWAAVPDDNSWELDEEATFVAGSDVAGGVGNLENPGTITVVSEDPTTEAPTTEAPMVSGDPHFVGFAGQRFNFDGVSGEVFSIISDKKFQLNALLDSMVVAGVNGTWMTGLGLVAANGETITADPVRGVLLNRRQFVTETIGFAGGFLSTSFAENGMLSSFHLVVEEFDITVVAQRNERAAYFDVIVTLRGEVGDVHGVLGQTARPEQRVNENFQVEGRDIDYLVKDGLLGTSCNFCRF